MVSKRYDLVVTGRMEGEDEEVRKVYPCSSFPHNDDEVRKIAEDFVRIRKAEVKTVIVRTSTVRIK